MLKKNRKIKEQRILRKKMYCCVTILCILLFGATLQADICGCALRANQSKSRYEDALKKHDLVFVGRMIDVIYLSPDFYLAVFEEQSLLRGEGMPVHPVYQFDDVPSRVQYVLVSEIVNDCTYSFPTMFETYLVFAFKTQGFFYADQCEPSSLYEGYRKEDFVRRTLASHKKARKSLSFSGALPNMMQDTQKSVAMPPPPSGS